MSLPKYKYLLTYRYAEMVCDLGVEFSRKFYLNRPLNSLSSLSNLGNLNDSLPVRRTVEQFIQALRSGKQNIIEGVSEIASFKSQIKLLGISSASFEEAIADLEDFLRQRELKIWPKTDPRIANFREIGYKYSNLINLSSLGNLSELPVLPKNAEEATNFLLTLLHIETFLLSKQIKSAENKFIIEGGYTEKLYNSRINFRREENLKELRLERSNWNKKLK
jgi:four helix bundle suffix protein